MRASPEHMQKIRSHILKAAGQGFREEGFGGLGINGLAQRAGLTSGAFYGHFKSKNEAFQEVVNQGLNDYEDAIAQFGEQYGEAWQEHFLNFYLGNTHVEDLCNSCVVPGLSADVLRADAKTKGDYSKSVKRIAAGIATQSGDNESGNSLALMALLAGTVMMARCISDKQLSKDLRVAARHWAEEMLNQPSEND
ncbi:TetR family transcriptional regulator [Alteromonadaceae bacterium 2753L.S.0a.02]|nr:TetR family transcriptional regulator [Alteromonadaceae bacterium 2753L.S.0a.02]